jgi:hypothetical protein
MKKTKRERERERRAVRIYPMKQKEQTGHLKRSPHLEQH